MLPWIQLALHPAESQCEGLCSLLALLAVIYMSSSYLTSAQQREAARKEFALTPESIIGNDRSWQQSWSARGPDVPQGDASSLVVDRSMQQPRHDNESPNKHEKLFQHILELKQRLYGSSAQVTIQGPRDLGTATAEINRYKHSYTVLA